MSAGKGDTYRKVNGEKYRSNKIFIRKTWPEWAKEVGDVIKSPDGFRDKSNDYLYSKREYEERIPDCTLYLTKRWPNEN